MNYEINKHYPFSELENIAEWWKDHREYDINEYEDYVEIIRRSDEQIISDLRASRSSLLDAFDKWEKAVVRGREEDDQFIMNWYQDILDLKSEAFNNIPERVAYYL